MSCVHDGSAPCAWEAHYAQAQDELLLARYEAKRWKEKFALEKQRRRKLARSLLDTMALVEDARRTRRSSSTFSDKDQIESLLSPTLSSFDFDDDDEEDDDDDDDDDGTGEAKASMQRLTGGVNANGSAAVSRVTTATATDGKVAAVPRLPNGDARKVPRASITRGTSHSDVRPARSSTVGSYDAGLARGGGRRRDTNMTLPPPNLLYRMLYAKSSSRDLWATQASKFQSVARSVMFSMQLKKEHVFEHFFITGMAIGRAEREQARRSPTGLVGFWKPRVFYEFAQRPGRAPDPTIADFCFPLGVPVVKCKPHQASTLLGSPVSIWTTDSELLQKHALDPFKSSGYTFRLTGAKGEVLYGFCVSVMREVITKEDDESQPPRSPRGEWAKRASCPNGSALRLSEPLHESYGSSFASKRESGRESGEVSYLAPVCYCFTSKFPFYKLQFSLLRLVIENDMLARQQAPGALRSADLYDITLTVESDLGVEFAVCRQPNASSGNDGPSASKSSSALSSVSSGLTSDRHGDASLSEEAPSISSSSTLGDSQEDTSGSSPHPMSSNLKKSFSSDDVTSYKSSNACVVEKPVVVRMTHPSSPRVAEQVQVGDVLEAIDGISTASLSFADALELVKSAPRPLKLRFHRLKSRKTSDDAFPSVSPSLTLPHTTAVNLAPTSADILQRARRLRIGDPGEWSTLRLPDYAMNYQFPKRDAERWSVGVVLRFLAPANIVKILAHLLLEKQVVIMGADSAHVSGTCTALLLLLAPFQWQSTYIPQLPSSLLDFLHSPVPFLVGCQPLPSTDEWPDVCFFDIDANVILAPIADHHINPKSIPHGDELSRLFHGAAQRYHRLRPSTKPWHELSDDEDKIITLTMQESQIFLKDICSELTSLHIAPVAGKSFYERLQEEVATIVRKSNFEDFLEEFSQTQLFCQYCEAVLNTEKSQEETAAAVVNGAT